MKKLILPFLLLSLYSCSKLNIDNKHVCHCNYSITKEIPIGLSSYDTVLHYEYNDTTKTANDAQTSCLNFVRNSKYENINCDIR